MRGSVNPSLRSASLSVRSSCSACANESRTSRPQFGRARRSSNTDVPSLSQRGSRLFDICSVMTCAISCHSVSGPRELAGRPRLGRIERDHAAEAGAEGADHAGQPERAHREVVVLGEHLDEDRPLRLELILLGERGERLLRQRHRELAHHRGLVGMQPHDDVALGDGLELVEGVHHLEQVIRDDVERVGTERRLQRSAGGGLVSRAQQVQAQIGVGAGALLVDGQGSPRQLRRLGEAIVARRVIARHTVGVAVERVDGEDLLGPRLEVAGASLEERNRGVERTRLEAVRVRRQRLGNRLARLVTPPVVEGELGDEQVRGHVAGVRLERAIDRLLRGRRVLFEQHPREPHTRRHMVLVDPQGRLEGLHRVGAVVFLEEQLAPGRIHDRIVGSLGARVA